MMAVAQIDQERQEALSDIITDVACRLEQLGATLEILSNGIHELVDGHFGEMPAGQQDHLYGIWLALQVACRDLKSSYRRMDDAEHAEMRDRLGRA